MMTLGNMRMSLGSLLILLATASHAQQSTILHFTCAGNYALGSGTKNPVQGLSVAVNLTEKTVAFGEINAPINKVDPDHIYFQRRNDSTFFEGRLNRITGAVNASIVPSSKAADVAPVAARTMHWNVICNRATRLF